MFIYEWVWIHLVEHGKPSTSHFFKRRNDSLYLRTNPLSIALQHLDRTGGNACHLCWVFRWLDLVWGLCRWCEIMIVTAMSCPEGGISYHLSGTSFIIRYMIQNWVKPFIPFLLKNPALHFPALWRLSITEDVFQLVGIDISLSHGPSVCYLQ